MFLLGDACRSQENWNSLKWKPSRKWWFSFLLNTLSCFYLLIAELFHFWAIVLLVFITQDNLCLCQKPFNSKSHNLHNMLKWILVRRCDFQFFTTHRMRKFKRNSMQQHVVVIPVFKKKPVLLIASMRTITYDWVKDMCQMFPDLMHAAGVGSDHKQRIAWSVKTRGRNFQFSSF